MDCVSLWAPPHVLAHAGLGCLALGLSAPLASGATWHTQPSSQQAVPDPGLSYVRGKPWGIVWVPKPDLQFEGVPQAWEERLQGKGGSRESSGPSQALGLQGAALGGWRVGTRAGGSEDMAAPCTPRPR